MHARWLSSAFLLIAASCAGFASPATSDGAKAIEQGYADYFGKAVVDKGIVSVSPDGDDYVVAWDLQKALDLAGPPKGALRIERFTYTLTPTGRTRGRSRPIGSRASPSTRRPTKAR